MIGTLQQKQQVAQVSPDDVLLIGSPVMSNDELVIAFVVLGQNGDPINGSILATAVEEGGNQLASALSTAVCCININKLNKWGWKSLASSISKIWVFLCFF